MERSRAGPHDADADQFAILASSWTAEAPHRVLKHGDTFAVFEVRGDIGWYGAGQQGLYHRGTRHLSACRLRVDGERPLLLSSRVESTDDLFCADLTNPDLERPGGMRLGQDLVHLFRARFLHPGSWHERLRITSYAPEPIALRLGLDFDADYVDIFEVRGTRRAARGRRLAPIVADGQVTLGYLGLDRQMRHTRISWQPAPDRLDGSTAEFDLALAPNESISIEMTVVCEHAPDAPALQTFERAFELLQSQRATTRQDYAGVLASNEHFNTWLSRSIADLHMMVTETPYGPYPYAGVPWFSTPFGRDGIIAALQMLWVNPALARGTLAYLAATQATAVDEANDAEPGKILHERRDGEMANLGEVPFGRYYGSVDSTPLFVLLAGAYYRRTADRAFIDHIWPRVRRAVAWIDEYGDVDGDGFVEYRRRSRRGLVQQGWKDSADSVFHADGRLAEGPIALCEVQGYVYAARREAAALAALLGDDRLASRQEARADALRANFESAFWSEEIGGYVLALDGAKRPCAVRTSNTGHCLFAGIADHERGRRTAATLLRSDLFSGWGIRTLATSECRYNPMSYHNGSVWPHDNALVGLGLRRYGRPDLAVRLLTGLFEASLYFDLNRLPELFCGFHRRAGAGPTLYPVACAPQTWASGAVFLLLQACLGLSIDAPNRRLTFETPMLPEGVPWIAIDRLVVCDAEVDLFLERQRDGVAVSVRRKSGAVEVLKLV